MNLQQRHLDEMIADFTGEAMQRFEAAKRVTESPIEALLFWAFWYVCDKNCERFGMAHGNEVPEEIPDDGSTVYLIRQARIGPYKADFAILYNQGSKVVAECDGHDFHERTKDQAQHDKSRDRFMQDKGWKVYRFTGSEIYRSPVACAESLLQSIWTASY